MVSISPKKTAIQRILYMAILIRLCSWPRITKLLNSNENAKYVQAEMLVFNDTPKGHKEAGVVCTGNRWGKVQKDMRW
jgi:hypothetical protein